MKIPFTLGFTLIELMFTLLLMAVTLTLGVPYINDSIRLNRLASNTNQFVTALTLARSEAVKRGVRVTLRKTSTNWEQGWQMFTDESTTGVKDGEDVVLREYSALSSKYTLRGNNNFTNFISFLPSGESTNFGSFALCDNSLNDGVPHMNTAKLIIINSVGRVRLGADADHNGIPDEDGKNLSSCINP